MSIDVMKQALDALERGETKLPYEAKFRYEAIAALRAAIEQIHTSVDSNTHQQPVAWLTPRNVDSYSRADLGYETGSKTDYGAFPVYTHPPAQEPVAYIGTNGELGWLKKPLDVRSVATPLYTTPPEFTCSTGLCYFKKPLTDEMNKQATLAYPDDKRRFMAFIDGWFSAEAAHGIKGKA